MLSITRRFVEVELRLAAVADGRNGAVVGEYDQLPVVLQSYGRLRFEQRFGRRPGQFVVGAVELGRVRR